MLTHKQAQLLRYVTEYQERYPGVSPSFIEMRDAVEIRSTSGVHRLLTALAERGFIERRPNRARAIKVLQQPMEGGS